MEAEERYFRREVTRSGSKRDRVDLQICRSEATGQLACDLGLFYSTKIASLRNAYMLGFKFRWPGTTN